jgi:hypothetical protein
MRKKYFLLIIFLLCGLAVFAIPPHRPFHEPPRFHRPHIVPPYIFIHPDISIYYEETIYVHRLGNIHIDKDISADMNDLSKIVFLYGLGSSGNHEINKILFFTDAGYDRIENVIHDFLEKKDIQTGNPEFDNLKTYNLVDNDLKLTFFNPNEYVESKYYGRDYYLYNLNYSLNVPINESVKSQFDKMTTKEFNKDINDYLAEKENLRIAGVSIFLTGLGLFGAMEMAGLITLYYSSYYGVPIAVPASLMGGGVGALTISLSVGVPIWAYSYAKKEYVIDFGN